MKHLKWNIVQQYNLHFIDEKIEVKKVKRQTCCQDDLNPDNLLNIYRLDHYTTLPLYYTQISCS